MWGATMIKSLSLIGISVLILMAFYIISNIVFFACVIPANTLHPQAAYLRSLFLSPDCVRACYKGIEPEVTTIDEAEAILSQEGISYRKNDIVDGHFELYVDDISLPRDFFSRSFFSLSYTEDNHDKIWQIWFIDFKVHYSLVIEAFGSPDQIVDGRLYDPSFNSFDFVYFSKGLYFNFDSETGISDDFRIVASRHQVLRKEDDPLAYYVCTVYGSLPCIAPTATSVSP